MSQRIILLFGLLLPGVSAYTQGLAQQVSKFDSKNTNQLEIKRTISQAKQALPFKRVDIVDARADTSSGGFYITTFDKVVGVTYPGGVANELKTFLHSRYSFSTGDTCAPVLLINLKRYRATAFLDTCGAETPQHQWAPAIIVKMEVYAGFVEGYKPLKRIAFNHLIENISAKTLEIKQMLYLGKQWRKWLCPLVSQ